MQNAFCIGKLVFLRPLETEDVPRLTAWFNAPEVTRTLLVQRPLSKDREKDYVARVNQSENDVIAGICTRELGLVGVVGLHQLQFADRRASLGVVIGEKDAWGRGYGSEAVALMVAYGFRTLNLHRITLTVLESNERACRIYDRLGFQREGVLRQEVFRDGRYWDCLVMGLLREEWERSAAARGLP